MAIRSRICFTVFTLLATSCAPSSEREPSDAGTTYADHLDAVVTTDYGDRTTERAADIADASAMMDVDSSRPPLPDVMSTDASTSTPDADVVTPQVVSHTCQTDGAALDNPERGWYSRKDIVIDRDFATAARIPGAGHSRIHAHRWVYWGWDIPHTGARLHCMTDVTR